MRYGRLAGRRSDGRFEPQSERRRAVAKKKSKAGQEGSRAAAKTPKTAAKADSGTIYQLKIALQDVEPPIWRRVETADCTLEDLHDIIQISMGWEDAHLHLFRVGGEQYGALDQWEADFDDAETKDERKAKLHHLVEQGVKKFIYEYDMGDSWVHSIQVEKTLAAEPKTRYPRCIDGARACPPEDCGGPFGYGSFLKAVQDPKHVQHAEMRAWAGDDFDPEAFDADKVSKELPKF
jgi:hypothetical protein